MDTLIFYTPMEITPTTLLSRAISWYQNIRNNGNMTFTQKYFSPTYGATKAMARDYDKDGDLGSVAISFFPEYDIAQQESIIYLEDLPSAFVFPPSTISQGQVRHWLVMDSRDIDND